MVDIMAIFGTTPVVVESYTGFNTYGETWADPQTITGWVNDQTHLVRSKDEEVVSQTILYMPIDSAAAWVENSLVTLPSDDRKRRVVTVNVNDSGGLPLPAHVEVHLT